MLFYCYCWTLSSYCSLLPLNLLNCDTVQQIMFSIQQQEYYPTFVTAFSSFHSAFASVCVFDGWPTLPLPVRDCYASQLYYFWSLCSPPVYVWLITAFLQSSGSITAISSTFILRTVLDPFYSRLVTFRFLCILHCVSKKNVLTLKQYSSKLYGSILTSFGRNVQNTLE